MVAFCSSQGEDPQVPNIAWKPGKAEVLGPQVLEGGEGGSLVSELVQPELQHGRLGTLQYKKYQETFKGQDKTGF